MWRNSLRERGLDVSYETVRSWVLKFGPMIARRLRQRRASPSDRRHLDEMVVRNAGRRMYLGALLNHEREILDLLVQRPAGQARNLTGSCASCGESRPWCRRLVVTDKLRSYGALPYTTSGSPATTSKDFAKIRLETRTTWCDDASARCSGSNQPHPRSTS